MSGLLFARRTVEEKPPDARSNMCFSSFFTALDRPVRSFIVSLFGTLVFPVVSLFILTAIWGLNGVWLMATVAASAGGILTLVLAATLKLKQSHGNTGNNPEVQT